MKIGLLPRDQVLMKSLILVFIVSFQPMFTVYVKNEVALTRQRSYL